MQQELKDIPRTQQEVRRQKGPIPLNAILLVVGLGAVLLLFFGLPVLETIIGD